MYVEGGERIWDVCWRKGGIEMQQMNSGQIVEHAMELSFYLCEDG